MKVDEKILELEKVLSFARLNPYIVWTDQNIGDAISLYSLNLKISGSMHTALHILEVSLRNSINKCLTKIWGEKWYLRSEITRNKIQKERISEAIFLINKKLNKKNPTNFQIVSNLNFGFWTTLFGKDYNILWGEHLHRVFDNNQSVQRKDVSSSLNDLRYLRNHIAHYERIIHLDLESMYQECRKLIRMISPIALEWCDSLCNFHEIHPGIPIIINGRANPNLDLSSYRFKKSNFNTKSPSK